MRYELSRGETNAGGDMPALQNEATSLTEQSALPEDVSHNLACLYTLWKLDFFDAPLYEQTKVSLPDSPDFEKDGEQTAIGGPAALLQWMIDEDLLGRAQFEALAERYVREGVGRKQNERDDLHRILIAMSVDSEFCERVFNAAMSRKNMWTYVPYLIPLAVLLFVIHFIMH